MCTEIPSDINKKMNTKSKDETNSAISVCSMYLIGRNEIYAKKQERALLFFHVFLFCLGVCVLHCPIESTLAGLGSGGDSLGEVILAADNHFADSVYNAGASVPDAVVTAC